MPVHFPLRTKLTLALLGMSLATIAVAGVTSRWAMLSRFDDLVTGRSFSTFEREISGYLREYGSFAVADSVEPFDAWVRRTGPRSPAGRPTGIPPRVRPGLGPGGGVPPEGEGLPAPDRGFAFGGAPPSFIVVDNAGTVLVTLGGKARGEVVDLSDFPTARPITVDGREVALALAPERPELTDLEREYLSAAEDSWVYAMILATILVFPVGLALGNHFAGPVLELTEAIRAMRDGNLHQTVEVRTQDELGQLSLSFNEMSEDLANVYDELRDSRSRLEGQASLLEELSRRDDLTSLLNRRAFDEEVDILFKRSVRYDHPLTLAMADVDHFKRVNDDFSHATGDAVLQEISTLIQDNIRDIDLVARYGGEEFAIAFAETTVEDAARLSERLRVLVEEHDWSRIAPGLAVTLSMGVGGRNGESSFKEVLNVADRKLYEAKSNGRNQVRV